MRIKADLLRVRTSMDASGRKLEPEAQPVERVMVTDFPAAMRGGNQVGSIPGEVVYEGKTAAQIAGAVRNPCFSCKHFDRAAWRKLRAAWEDPATPMENRQLLNGVRVGLLESNNATISDKSQTLEGELDVEHAMGLLGVCHPLTELDGDVVIVYPNSACPDAICTPQQPAGFYVARDRDAERMGSENYDRIMRLAAGKAP